MGKVPRLELSCTKGLPRVSEMLAGKVTGKLQEIFDHWVIPQRPARHTQCCYNFDTLNERTPAGFTIRPLKDDSYTASTRKYVLKF